MKPMLKKALSVVLSAGILVGALSACSTAGGGSDNSEDKKTFKLAAIIPGSINDGSWGTLGYNAAKTAAETYGAEFSYVETNSPADALEAVEDYSARGFDLIFAHSNDYSDPCERVASRYPDTHYLVTSGSVNNENVTSMSNKAWESMYLAGVVAAKTTETKKIGFIGSQELPNIVEGLVGFKHGALATDPEVEVVVTFTGSSTDVAKAKESALAMINNDVDVIVVNANKAAEGCYAAGMENLGKVKMISANSNRFEDYPELMLANQSNNYTISVCTVFEDVINGTFESGSYVLGVADGATDVELSPHMEIAPEVQEAYEAAKQGITDGSIVVCRTEEELAAQ